MNHFYFQFYSRYSLYCINTQYPKRKRKNTLVEQTFVYRKQVWRWKANLSWYWCQPHGISDSWNSLMISNQRNRQRLELHLVQSPSLSLCLFLSISSLSVSLSLSLCFFLSFSLSVSLVSFSLVSCWAFFEEKIRFLNHF